MLIVNAVALKIIKTLNRKLNLPLNSKIYQAADMEYLLILYDSSTMKLQDTLLELHCKKNSSDLLKIIFLM